MTSIKHFSNLVPVEPFIHKAPLGASIPLPPFGKRCFNPTSNNNNNKKSKANSLLHESEALCLFHGLLCSQHAEDARCQWSTHARAGTNEPNKSSPVHNPGRGSGFVWLTATVVGPSLCPDKHWNRYMTNGMSYFPTQLLTSVPNIFLSGEGQRISPG